jgi:hypothetical protein
VKLLSDTVSLVDPDICPRKAMVTLSAVLTLVDPSAVENARVLPQLCPLHGWAEELIAKSMIPANAVSAEEPLLDITGVPPQDTWGVKPVDVPACENWYRTSTRSPVVSKPAGSVQVPRLVELVLDVISPTALQTTCGVVNVPSVLFGLAYR